MKFVEKNLGLIVSVIITLFTVAFAYGKIVEKVEKVDMTKVYDAIVIMKEDVSALKADVKSVKEEQNIMKSDVKELIKCTAKYSH